ncbi:MAG: HAD hydrolase-like protein [Nitrososphaeraceae archaeon]|nr:HAD hydrolase-like protein [Nitrososphaeraceae archaeon]
MNGTLVNEDYLRHDEVLENILNCKRKGRKLTIKDLRKVSKGECTLSHIIDRLYLVQDPEIISHSFFSFQASRITVREKTLDVLMSLVEKYKLILCSDTTGIAEEVVKKLDFSKYFTKIFYSCEIGYLKEEEEFWNNLFYHFPKAKPQDFLVVGDNPRSDLYYPNRLGLHTIQIANPIRITLDYRAPPTNSNWEKPDYYIKNIEEILYLLP